MYTSDENVSFNVYTILINFVSVVFIRLSDLQKTKNKDYQFDNKCIILDPGACCVIVNMDFAS